VATAATYGLNPSSLNPTQNGTSASSTAAGLSSQQAALAAQGAALAQQGVMMQAAYPAQQFQVSGQPTTIAL